MKDNVLQKLRPGKFVSGQQIADELRISRTAVFKQIKALKKIGFKIESVPNQGYMLTQVSPKLHPLVVNKCLKTRIIGKQLMHFDQVASTINKVTLMAETADEGLVVVAEKQTNGRGRFGRRWVSPAGGIWASILLRPNVAPTEATRLNIIASLAIAEAISEKLGLIAQIKWPNDVIVSKRKVAGILTDMVAELDKINYAVLSFGIDVNNRIPNELQGSASSLKSITGASIDRTLLFCGILNKVEHYYTSWQKGDFNLMLRNWKKLCVTIGKEIEVKGLNRLLKGKAVGIDDMGRLILAAKDGKRHTLSSGEVSILEGNR